MRTSRALVVAVTMNGVSVPGYGEDPAIPLDLAGLLLLGRLSSGSPLAEALTEAEDAAADRDALADLAARLEGRHLLTNGPAVVEPLAEVVRSSPAGAARSDDLLVMPNPVLFRCHDGGFETLHHDGTAGVHLDAVELLGAARFCLPIELGAAHEAHRLEAGSRALDRTSFDELAAKLAGAGMLRPFRPGEGPANDQVHHAEAIRAAMRSQADVNAEFDRLEREHDEAGGPAGRVKVIGVHTSWSSAPAALGVLIAYAKAFEGGMLQASYDFRPRLLWTADLLEDVANEACVFLFSNYVWNHEQNLELSALVKRCNPESVVIHGGPDTPKYERDCEQYFADHPHVDVCVRGEGEATLAHALAALRETVGNGRTDLGLLAGVSGLTYRDASGVIRTDDRDRIADLDTIPSPLLTGIFDGFLPAGTMGAVAMETNRGCPYGCTFCDWGSATLSRIRKFDLERLFAELEWCATNHIQTIGIADANFGILERDVLIAERIAELKGIHGYPQLIGNNYAKNTVKHLSRIIEVFTEAGIVAEGKMSMQSFDTETLATIRRKNIKVEKYDDLSVEFRKNRLPLSVDLMIGLPGATVTSFLDDLQECVNRDVRVALHPTMLLPNSPMNDPEYREEHGIVAKPGEYVRETTSYTRDEWEHMHRLGAGFWLLENFGILRHVAMYVRADSGIREVDFYDRLLEDAFGDPESWPYTHVVLRVLPNVMVPPVSWALFLDEVRRHVTQVEGVADDGALDTVLRVQHALLPARERHFPLELSLEHDYADWHRRALETRDAGHRDDWSEFVPELRSFGSGALAVDDPYGICMNALDGSLAALVVESSWDFDSPVSRPRQRQAVTT